ncbi:MAG: hypothetical protein ACJARP_000003 [Vicingaceae bacterium]
MFAILTAPTSNVLRQIFIKNNIMQSIQLVQVSPTELVNLINEELVIHIENLLNQLSKHPQEKEVLTRKDCAELLGVSLVTLHDWNKKGIITPYKLGNRTFYKRSQIMESLSNSNTMRA